MSEQSDYQAFKVAQLGKHIFMVPSLNLTNPYGVQCVTLGWLYANYIFPGIPMAELLSEGNANTVFAAANPKYFQKIANDISNPNQVPQVGDIMCFGPTPNPRYTNKFYNPEGHEGICDSANSSHYSLLQQNAPGAGEGVNVTTYPWLFRPCQGWLRAIK